MGTDGDAEKASRAVEVGVEGEEEEEEEDEEEEEEEEEEEAAEAKVGVTSLFSDEERRYIGTAIGVERGIAVAVAVEAGKEFLLLDELLMSNSATVRSLVEASIFSPPSLLSLPALLEEASASV